MTLSMTGPIHLARPNRLESPGAATICPGFIRVALCVLALLTVVPEDAQAQGSLVTWGGELLDDPGTVSETPTGTFIAVAAGNYHSHAIRADGTLVSWGSDLYAIDHGLVLTGQISDTPAGTFTAVSAGDRHSVAIRTDGTLVSWGLDNFGVVSDTPAGTFIAVSAGYRHSTAIRTDGTLVDWGADINDEFNLRPTTGTYVAVAAGDFYSLAIRSDGTLVAWGDHLNEAAVNVPAGTFKAVSTSGLADYNLAIRTDGTLVAWGSDTFGLVNDIPAGTYSAVSAGANNAVAIRTDPLRPSGTLVSWGFDGVVVSNTPTGSFSAVAAGSIHAVAIRVPLTVLIDQVGLLSLSVQNLVLTGAPLPASGQALQTKLDAAAGALTVNDPNSAIGSLGAFINQTGAYVKTKKLTAAQGQGLVDAAKLIITNLGG